MPVLLIFKLLNVATPATAFALVVPVSVPPPGFVPIAVLTVAVEAVRLPYASSMRTVTAGVTGVPATVFTGCTLNTSLLAAATVTLNVALVAAVRVPLVAWSV